MRADFPQVDPDVVEAVVLQSWEYFADARVQQYRAVLTERYVREEIERRGDQLESGNRDGQADESSEAEQNHHRASEPEPPSARPASRKPSHNNEVEVAERNAAGDCLDPGTPRRYVPTLG